MRLWSYATGAPVATLRGHGGCVNALAAVRGNILASGSEDGSLRVWSVAFRVVIRAVDLGCGIRALAALDDSLHSAAWEATARCTSAPS